jgi:hypothetical protein
MDSDLPACFVHRLGLVPYEHAWKLQETMDDNDRRIADLNLVLNRERESLLEEFFRLETVIGQLQNNLNAVSQIQALPPLTLGR